MTTTAPSSRAIAQADRMVAAAREGQSSFFKSGSDWLVLTPGHHAYAAQRVEVTKADGTVKAVVTTEIVKTGSKDGVDYTIARFRDAVTTDATSTAYSTRTYRDGSTERHYADGSTVTTDASGTTITYD